MKLTKSRAAIYNVIHKHLGENAAKDSLIEAVYKAVSVLQESGQPITEESLEKLLQAKTTDHLQVPKKKAA